MPVFGLQPSGLLERIFEQVGIAVVVIDHQQKLVFANETATAMFRRPSGEPPATFEELRQNYRLEDPLGNEIPIEEAAVTRALRGEHVESEELHARFPDGSTKWLLTWAYPFSVVGLTGVLALMIDETVQVELRRAATQLERMETLGVLAAGLAHDFNNVLDTITLSIGSLLIQPGTVQNRQRLDQILDATTEASKLVKRLMQFSRVQDLHYRPVNVNDVVADALRLVRPLLRSDIVVTTNLADGLPYIVADSSQLEQVIVNLIVNAIDALPNGGELKISTAVESGSKTRNSDEIQDCVSIRVADTGVGIPPELQPHIFEPFFTTKPAGKGTGLGLSSVYGIVKQHNGKVIVSSAPGAGAEFLVSFPISKVAAFPPRKVG
jgi:two-component system, cell cycle sensor histidine kinase and response regulator CckA